MRTEKEKRAARVALQDDRAAGEVAADGAAAELARVLCSDAADLQAGMGAWSPSMRIRAGVATDAELRAADAAGRPPAAAGDRAPPLPAHEQTNGTNESLEVRELRAACMKILRWFNDEQRPMSAGELLIPGCGNELRGDVDRLRGAMNRDAAPAKVGAAMGGHTPGPWKAFEYREDSTGEICVGVSTDYPPGQLCNGSRSIATMTGGHYTRPGEFHNPEAAPVNRANARLIAAAPDLLAALRGLLDYAYAEEESLAYLCKHDSGYDDAHAACQGAIRIARAAIARAGGAA